MTREPSRLLERWAVRRRRREGRQWEVRRGGGGRLRTRRKSLGGFDGGWGRRRSLLLKEEREPNEWREGWDEVVCEQTTMKRKKKVRKMLLK